MTEEPDADEETKVRFWRKNFRDLTPEQRLLSKQVALSYIQHPRNHAGQDMRELGRVQLKALNSLD